MQGCLESSNPSADRSELSTAFATVPSGFQEMTVTSALASPTAMDIASDGRVFVCEQGGRVRVIKNGALLTTPFVTIGNTAADGERGLVGITLDPAFPSSPFVYVYYTVQVSPIHNRVSRFTVSSGNADVADPASELVLLDLDNLSTATNHNGGGMHFGPDGKLYIGVGENANGSNSQSLSTVLGKILRINKDGTIPSDNPFVASTSGKNKAIWAMGLRNPFTSAFQPGTGRYFINDVGENTWEEIDDGIAGRNYGWPTAEGTSTNGSFANPFYTYVHSGGDCAITGGAFYNPVTAQFPSDFAGNYFFCDYCGGWIKRIDPASKTVTTFITGIANPVDVKVDKDGSLYYLSIGSGSLRKVTYASSQAPTISQQPAGVTVTQGGSATFTVSANGGSPLAYRWQRNGADISGATASSYTLSPVQASDNGAKFHCIVSNSSGSVTSSDAVLTVTSDQAPAAAITAPASGATYFGGQVINYAGTGTDPEDGALPDSDYTWVIVFHHDLHTHPFLGPITGVKSGSFTIPTQGETSSNVWYRIHFYVKDAQGMMDSTYRDVLPLKTDVTLASTPGGLQLLLDGQPVTAPYTFTGVVGIQRSLGVTSPQSLGGKSYQFSSWSDGGAQGHVIATPGSATTYTAAFNAVPGSNSPPTDTILTPAAGSTYGGGSVIWYSGSAKDPEQGDLPSSALTWKVDFHHDGQVDAFLAPWSGQGSGSFQLPNTGSASTNVFYRLTLTARDSQGLTATVYRDILPRLVNVTLTSSPTGLQVLLDGQSFTTPYTFTGVQGMNRNLEAPLNETLNGQNWKFDYWSNGQARVQVLTTPTTATTYGANYVAVAGGSTGTGPAITGQPAGVTVAAGSSATFSVTASGTAPLGYQWQRNASNISGATAASYTLASAQSADSGARFRCLVTNAYGSATSNDAVLTVTTSSGGGSNLAPTDTILTPTPGSTYGGGSVIWYSGSAKDPEQGNLTGTAFTWKVDFYHDGQVDAFLAPWSGQGSGSFQLPNTGSASTNVFYRLTLTVRDNQGSTAMVYRDILPRLVTVKLTSSPLGLQLLLDGQGVTTPYTFTGIAGMNRNLEAPLNETLSGQNWKFDYWSNGQPRAQVLITPTTATTYGANYVTAP